MSTIAATASLAVAVLDLKLVQDVVGAMRAADAASAADRRNPLTPLPTIASPHHYCPDPVYAPRRHIHPEPLYEPRPIIHPQPRYDRPAAPRLALQPDRASSIAPCHMSPRKSPAATLAVPPRAPAPAKMKVVVNRTDILTKGSLIDMFI